MRSLSPQLRDSINDDPYAPWQATPNNQGSRNAGLPKPATTVIAAAFGVGLPRTMFRNDVQTVLSSISVALATEP